MAELETELTRWAILQDGFEVCRHLNRPEDVGGAFVAIRPAAGPTADSFDWVGLLARMYRRHRAERQAIDMHRYRGASR